MRIKILVLLSLLATPLAAPTPASATETTPAVQPKLAEPRHAEGPRAPRMNLKEVKVAAQSKDAAADLPARGSFWWLVGVIVVAGVILAVLL